MQKIDGKFVGIVVVVENVVETVIAKFQVSKEVVFTAIAIAVFSVFFAERKVEWNLLVKKAEHFLQSNHVNEELKQFAMLCVKERQRF